MFPGTGLVSRIVFSLFPAPVYLRALLSCVPFTVGWYVTAFRFISLPAISYAETYSRRSATPRRAPC